MESIAEALQLYHSALSFLGPRAVRIDLRTAQQSGRSYDSLLPSNSGLENPLVLVEDLLTVAEASVPTIRIDPASPPTGPVGYFCTPKNRAHEHLWDVLEDRLYKIRNCMNIEGIRRELPLFEPPIDPGQLIAAAAAGVALTDLRPSRWVSPHVRFGTMLAMARQLASSVQRLSGALQSALQSRDGEAMTRLRQEHELTVLDLGREIRDMQVTELEEQRVAAQKRKAGSRFRLDHYKRLIETSLIDDETKELESLDTAAALNQGATIYSNMATVASWIPQYGLSGPSHGGLHISSAYSAIAGALQGAASRHASDAGRYARNAANTRRAEDWGLQASLAQLDEEAAEADLVALDERIAIARQERSNHETQIDLAREVDQMLRTRFTNEELFDWMVGELTSLHSSSFQLALEVARKAEVCFRRELGVASSNYVGAAYWNASRNGLLAADKLLADLDRMEVAFVEQDRRELEITKQVSLRRLDPMALVTLQQTGVCDFDIPEALYDLDFHGHYYRRIKAVSVTIPCVNGPHTSIHGTLSLMRSQVRTSKVPVGDYGNLENYDHERWTERIALSAGRDDSGLFSFDFRDAKYLPFEHRGAISSWNLSLSGSDATPLRPQFDWASISDMVMTVRYTARHDATLASDARTAVDDAIRALQGADPGGEHPIRTAISLRRDVPDVWRQLRMLETDASTDRMFDIDFDWNRLPYVSRELGLVVARMDVILVPGPSGLPTSGPPFGSGLTGQVGIGPTFDPTTFTTNGIGSETFVRRMEFGQSTPVAAGPGQRLFVQLIAGASGFQEVLDAQNHIDPEKLHDIVIVLDLLLPASYARCFLHCGGVGVARRGARTPAREAARSHSIGHSGRPECRQPPELRRGRATCSSASRSAKRRTGRCRTAGTIGRSSVRVRQLVGGAGLGASTWASHPVSGQSKDVGPSVGGHPVAALHVARQGRRGEKRRSGQRLPGVGATRHRRSRYARAAFRDGRAMARGSRATTARPWRTSGRRPDGVAVGRRARGRGARGSFGAARRRCRR
ncbi:MAG: hypothetical protein AAF211_17740, partial [Myxococcota bacterium]